ncbi:site-specific DNA-methyltransferase [Phocaeicola coprocola]|uniref:site-specific DNA-methyltransferase n=1 Tax=Phocaeicola coprocola TaxID=310298 RepID=UPI00242BBFB5|nr:site-specific DNA-methyltransferase [Phocaeicola coprocola]
MKPNKLELSSVDGTQLNLEALYQIAPSCFTEVKDDKTGELRHVVNFKTLRQLLGDNAVEDADEMYQFTWPGKQEARREAARPTTKTLRPVVEDSVDWDHTQNLYIEGDNLEVLKLLQKSYMGKVKMIYIDPPYNTGNDFVYDDDFAVSQDDYDLFAGDVDELGNRYRKNTDSNGRFHSDWCSMIYPRLMVARSLLAENGVIFISIDDREADNMIKICDEIFGENSFVGNISWQKTYSPRNDSKGIPAEKESIIVYGKNEGWMPKKLERTEDMNSKYKNPDNDVMPWTSDNPCAPGARTHQGMVYAIQHPFTGELLYPAVSSCWRYQQQEMLNHMNGWCEYELRDLNDEGQRAKICGIDEKEVRRRVKAIVLKNSLEESRIAANKILQRGQWPKFYFTKNGKGGIRRKTYLENVEGRMVTNLWPYIDVGHTDEAKKELKALFDGEIPFDTPKPVRLIQRMVEISSENNDIILDFFSGAATTAQSIMQQNSLGTNGENRRFILVQIPEKTNNKYRNLCEIGKERIRRAGKKIKEESPLTTQNLDTGFRVFRLADSNFEDVKKASAEYNQSQLDLFLNNVKSDRTDLDLLFGAMLSWGVQLSLPMTSEEVDGKMIYSVNDGDLVACFANDITENIVKAMADKQPLRVLFRDSCFARDDAKINVFETLKQLLDWSEEEAIKNIKVI